MRDDLDLTYRPIDRWPGTLRAHDERRHSTFKATHGDTLVLLVDELLALDAVHPVIQLALRDQDLRLDGTMRANAARPAHPGVVLSFDSKHGALKYATDVFREPRYTPGEAWHANLRAIALGLNALRAVDRYGITRRGEQYTGWRALPAGIAVSATAPAAFDTVEDAARFLVEHGEWGGSPGDPVFLIEDESICALYYRNAAKSLHPDQGGDADLFARLGEARRMVDTSRR